jgi:GTP-binding protein HflX
LSKIHGNLQGLSTLEKSGLERLAHHVSAAHEIASDALVVRMCGLAARIKRQVGVLIDRNGRVTHVLAGSESQVHLPDLGRWGKDSGRLRGLRLVHVHLKGEPVDDDDLNDLARLGLDLVAAVSHAAGVPQQVSIAHIAADRTAQAHRSVDPATVLPSLPWAGLAFDCAAHIEGLEAQLLQVRPAARMVDARARALLIHVGPEALSEAEDRLDELEELARTARVEVVGRVIQRRREVDARTLIGSGKLGEIALKAMQADATALIFDRELTPSQSKSIAQQSELKVIDRTQLILDIFARRARSQDGKLQVELAQLRYSLPRLGDRDNALSRLAGGIGGTGPGETKLEIDRRRARERIHRIETELGRLKRGRGVRRQGRSASEVPAVALVGYTNVGKSSLLNALAKADAYTENLLFATLDPTTRRIRLDGGTQVVVTDTVGFIRDLPKELLGAFEATLEEAAAADLLLVVVDGAHAQMEQQLASVLRILGDHGLGDHPRRVVVNKCDAVRDPAAVREVALVHHAWQVSAATREGLAGLMAGLEPAVLVAQSERQRQAGAALAQSDFGSWSPLG